MLFGCVGEYDDLDLPQLHSIELDYCALRGDKRDEQKALEEKPYNYKNTLIMKSGCSMIGVMTDLPSLTSFKSYRCSFQFVGSVMLESTDSWSVSYRYHGVEFVSAMSAFNGSIPFSHNVTMLVYRHLLSLKPLKLPFGEEAFVSSRSVVLLCSLCDVGFVMNQFAVLFVNVDCFRIMEHEK